MGAISPSKMPKKKIIHRKDDPDSVELYAKGGKIKKFSGDDEESLVELANRGLSGERSSNQGPTEEELATGKMRPRPMNLDYVREGVTSMPMYANLDKNYQSVGMRTMGTKKLDKDSMLQAYVDADISKARGDKVRGRGTGFGVQYVRQFDEGGEVWDKPNPAKKHKKLSPAKKASAKAAAKAAGRPYPNLVDNMRAARKK